MSAPAPLGLLFLARGERGLRHLLFMDRRSLKRVIAGLAPAEPDAEWRPSLLDLKPVVDQLDAYFSGTLRRFDVPLDPVGTGFQLAVWHELARIPFATTRSYGEVAQAVGQPRSARAVGLANHQNPIAIVVPCHRVVGADGSLTGYGGGLPRKRWLLEHERRFAALDARTERSRAPIVKVEPPPPRPAARGRAATPAAAGRSRATAGRAAAARTPRRRAGA
jgi:methylated-DNA-[protein]-cysteine S-methyltransferase